MLVGLLIGAVGIGGVLLVPALTFVADLSIHEAIPACMLSYLATGTVAVLVYARHGSIAWDKVKWLCLGAVPAAYLGSVSLLSIPAPLVMLIIASLMIFAGIDALRKLSNKTTGHKPEVRIGRVSLIVIGSITGFGSAITGTGGPLIIVPIIVFLGLPVLTAVGLSQAIQIPIATFASIGNWMAGNLNVSLGLVIAGSMVMGTLIGAMLVHRLPEKPIRMFVAVLLVVVGTGIGLQLVYSQIATQVAVSGDLIGTPHG
jgi:uncharacterized membrane protein YfcA